MTDITWLDRTKDEGFPTAHRVLFDKTEEGRDEKYLHYRREFVRRAVEFDKMEFPCHLDIESHSGCNERCPQCFRQTSFFNRNNPLPNEGMSIETFEKIMKEAEKYTGTYLYSTKKNFRGEPTLSENLEYFLKREKEIGIIETMFNTNGMFDGARLPGIMENLDQIAFSIDSIDESTFNKIRVGGEWPVVTGNVHEAIRLRDEGGYKTKVRVSFTHMVLNADQLEPFEKYWIEAGVDKVTINLAFQPGMLSNKKNYKSPYKIVQDDMFVCSQPWQRMMIMSSGVVTTCCGSWGGTPVVGKIGKDTIYDMWHGKQMEFMRTINREHRYKSFPLCANCGVSQNTVVRQ